MARSIDSSPPRTCTKTWAGAALGDTVSWIQELEVLALSMDPGVAQRSRALCELWLLVFCHIPGLLVGARIMGELRIRSRGTLCLVFWYDPTRFGVEAQYEKLERVIGGTFTWAKPVGKIGKYILLSSESKNELSDRFLSVTLSALEFANKFKAKNKIEGETVWDEGE